LKDATQSTIYPSQGGHDFTAEKAIDGNQYSLSRTIDAEVG
jgi:hypothetical protein